MLFSKVVRLGVSLSRGSRKQVGKQITRKKYRRVRYDLVIVGAALIIAGVLVYNIILAVRPPNVGSNTTENLVDLLKKLISTRDLNNRSVVLLYKVRGNVPSNSFILGTLDYVYLYVNKEVILRNNASNTTITYRSIMYSVQEPLYVLADVLGLAFRSSNFSDIFFNPSIVSTWINLTVEKYGEEKYTSNVLGDISVVSQLFKYRKPINGKLMFIEVRSLRAIEFGLLPIRVTISIDGNKLELELVNISKAS